MDPKSSPGDVIVPTTQPVDPSGAPSDQLTEKKSQLSRRDTILIGLGALFLLGMLVPSTLGLVFVAIPVLFFVGLGAIAVRSGKETFSSKPTSHRARAASIFTLIATILLLLIIGGFGLLFILLAIAAASGASF